MEAAGGGSRGGMLRGREARERWCSFQMPLNYPKLTKADYETMPEADLDRLLSEYGLPVTGDVEYKRRFAMGAFLWAPSPDSVLSSAPVATENQ